jgi:thermitase
MKLVLRVCLSRLASRYVASFPTLLALAAAGLMLGAHGTASAQGQGQGPMNMLPKKHVQGRVLVQPRPGLSMEEFDKILKLHGGRRGAAIKQLNVHIIELPPQANAPAIADALRRNPHIKFAEVDGVLEPELYPSDPYYSSGWHLPKIGAPTAWDSAQGNGVTIAILDSGIDATHPDLQSQIVPGWNFYDNNSNVADVHGHGTRMAGIAAAATNNGLGVAAVSFQSKIMPLRVTDTSGYGYYSMMAAALTTAADNGVRVANISFLGVSLSSTVDSAAQYMRSKGGVVVVSGGNTGVFRSDPPRSSLTVVSATDMSDGRWSSSSWGSYIDIAAPGVGLLTTTSGGSYGTSTGTSASSAVVAGVYALMMSAKPALQPAALDNILFSTAQDLGTAGYDQYFGAGRVNAASAVAAAAGTSASDTQPPSVAIALPTNGGNVSGLVAVDVTATDNVGVARVELLANGTLKATDTTAPFGMTLDSTAYVDGPLSLQARAYDAAGNSASSSTVTVTVANDTVPPVVAILNPAAGSTVSGTVPINVSATDNQRVAKISLTIDGNEVALSYGSSLSFNWNATNTKGKGKGNKSPSSTRSTIVARAEDSAGNTATATVNVTKQ